MNVRRERRCRGCNESGHNIRSCMKELNETIILKYAYTSMIELPFHLNENKVNKLCQMYGLSINATITQKKERLHNIYIHLGRQRVIDRLIVPIYRPSYLPTPSVLEGQDQRQERQRILPLSQPIYLFNLLQQHQQQQNNNNNNIVQAKQKPSIQIMVNKDKFPSDKEDVNECPVCYEECQNMIVTDCNHSYCQPCISKLMNTINRNTLPCPLCRENIKNVFVFSENSSDLMLQI
jgi:hypothetical protein